MQSKKISYDAKNKSRRLTEYIEIDGWLQDEDEEETQ